MCKSRTVVVIGAGYGADSHIPAIQSAGGSVVAIADNGSGRAVRAASKIGSVAYSDWQLMLREVSAKAVVIALPPYLHEIAISLSINRFEIILCEKPFGTCLQEALRMRDSVAESRSRGVIGFQFRYDPWFKALKRLVQEESFGEVERIDVSWLTSGYANASRPLSHCHSALLGGGVARNYVSHVFDYIPWLLNKDDEMIQLSSSSQILIPERPDSHGTIQPVTAEDSYNFSGVFGKTQVTISACSAIKQGHGHRIEIYGTEKSAVLQIKPPFGISDVSIQIHQKNKQESVEVILEEGGGKDLRINAEINLWKSIFSSIEEQSVDDDLPSFDDGVRVQKILSQNTVLQFESPNVYR